VRVRFYNATFWQHCIRFADKFEPDNIIGHDYGPTVRMPVVPSKSTVNVSPLAKVMDEP
jgi:hypothetical protein